MFLRIYRSQPLDPILNRLIPVNIITTELFKIHFNILLQPTSSLQSDIFASGFPIQIVYGLYM
jgi:hypothetical protein